MPYKKRFVLKKGFDTKKLKLDYKKTDIQEYYTYINKCKIIKYMQIDKKYYQIIISHRNDIKKIEIDKNLFEKKKTKKISHLVFKIIFILDQDRRVILYKKGYKGLKILELNHSQSNIDDFKSYIDEDVSTKRGFEGIELALYGNPLDENKNIHKIMKKINDLENVNMQNIIKNDMPVDNAVRVKLYELYLRLVQDRFDILKNQQNKANILTAYRDRLSTIIFLLKEFDKCFDSKLVKKVDENLNYIYNKTHIEDDLKSIKYNLKHYYNCLDIDELKTFLITKDDFITKEVEKFSYFMQTREYSIILKQLELLIKESSISLEEESEIVITIQKQIKKSIKKRYKKVKKSIKRYIDCEDAESYYKILKKVKKLESINHEFGFLNDTKKTYKIKTISTNLHTILEETIRCMRNINIAKSNIKDASSLDCLIKKFTKKKEKSLKKLKKSIKEFKKSDKLFLS